jgi:hypothetical protein
LFFISSGVASDKIRRSKNKALIEHHLTSNTALALKLDTEDDGLVQVLTIINNIPVAERQEYIKQLAGRLGTKSKSKVARILADKEACIAAMRFNKLSQLRSTTGGGMSIRHLISWSPAIGGVSPDGDLVLRR